MATVHPRVRGVTMGSVSVTCAMWGTPPPACDSNCHYTVVVKAWTHGDPKAQAEE